MATQDYVLNGTTTFTFPFAVRSASLLTLELVPGGVVSTGDYTVTGAGPTSTGVTVTYPDAPTSATTVLRITRYVQPDRITTLNGPSDITVANLNAEFDNAYDAIADFQVAGVNIAQAVLDAEAAEAAAQAAQAAAEAAVGSVDLPVIAGGDAGKILRANGAEDGYELTAALLDGEVTAEKLAASVPVPVLLSTTAIAAGATVDLPTVFTDNPGYAYYKVVLDGFLPDTGGDALYVKVTINSGVDYGGAGGYRWSAATQGSSLASLAYSNHSSDNKITASGAISNEGLASTIVTFQGVARTDARKPIGIETIAADFASVNRTIASGTRTSASAFTGLRFGFIAATDFLARGTVKVYGSNTPF